MGCGANYQQINQLTHALNVLERAGLGSGTIAYNELYRIRGKLYGQLGLKFPRSVVSILKLVALSPGTITLWNDIESGWMTSAREAPGSPVVWRYVSDDIALKLLKRDFDHELEEFLWTPDPYIGE